MKTLILTSRPITNSNKDFLFLPAFQSFEMLQLFKPHSFDNVTTIDEEVEIEEVNDKLFWK
jgi:hypothetical protein